MSFGDCPTCDGQLERPFWDTVCFTCQEDERVMWEEDEEEARLPANPVAGPSETDEATDGS